MNQSELEKILKNITESKDCSSSYTAEQIREIFLSLHELSVNPICYSSEGLDKLLSINYAVDKTTSFSELERKYGAQEFWIPSFIGVPAFQSPYPDIMNFFHQTHPKKSQVVYDLGSGFGRVVFYGGLVTDAFIKGVEIVPARVEECNRIKENLKLENISFIQANVLDVDISDGDIFFMYHPFSRETGHNVFEKLKKVSEQKPITVAVNLRVHGLNKSREWLKLMYSQYQEVDVSGIKIFSSK